MAESTDQRFVERKIYCLEICDFEACWYEAIYLEEEDAERHKLDYRLKEDEQSKNVVTRDLRNLYVPGTA